MVARLEEFDSIERSRIALISIVEDIEDLAVDTKLAPAALAGREDPVLVVDVDGIAVHIIGIQAVIAGGVHQGAVGGARLGVGPFQPEAQGVVILVGGHVAAAPVPPLVHDRGADDRAVPAAHDDEGAGRSAAVQDASDRRERVRSLQRILELGVGDRVGAGFPVVGGHHEGSRAGAEVQRAAGPDAGRGAELAVRELEVQGLDFHGGHVQSARDQVHHDGAHPVVPPVVGNDGGADLGLQAEVDRRPLAEPGIDQRLRVAGFLGAGEKGRHEERRKGCA